MSAIYNYADSISDGNTLNETLAGMNRQIAAQNSLARDNFNTLRQDEKNNRIAAQNNLSSTKIKDRESEGLEGAGVFTTINELSKRRGAANKLAETAKGFASQAEQVGESLRPLAEGGSAGEVLSTASRSGQAAVSGLPQLSQNVRGRDLPSLDFFNSSPAEVPVSTISRSGPIVARDASRGSDLPSLDFFNSSPAQVGNSVGGGATNIVSRGEPGSEPTSFELQEIGPRSISTGGLPKTGPAVFKPMTTQQVALQEGLSGVNVGGELDPDEAEAAEKLALRPTDLSRSRFLDIDQTRVPAGQFSRLERPTQPKENELRDAEPEETTAPDEATDILKNLSRSNEPVISDVVSRSTFPTPNVSAPTSVNDLIRPVAEAPTPTSNLAGGVAKESLRESLKAGGSQAPTFASRQIARSTLPEGSEANVLGGAAEVAERPAEDVVEDVGEDAGGVSAGAVVGGLLKGATIATGAYDAIKDIADPKSFKKLDKLGKVSNVAGVITGGLETAGLAADATGVGAVVGVPLQALGLVSGAVGLGAGVLDDIFGEKKKQAQVKKMPTISPTAKAPQQKPVAFRSALGGGELVQ